MPRIERFYDANNPELVPSLVCVADVLGFSARVLEATKQGNASQLLDQLHAVLTQANAGLNEHADRWRDERPYFATKWFTDNLVVGCPLTSADQDGESETGVIYRAFAEHQASLAAAGFFIRGGIAFGDHYMDDLVVFGPALLEAHEMDAKGGPPRICLAPSHIRMLELHLSYYSSGEAPHLSQLLKDDDGRIFLNYLAVAFEDFPYSEVNFDLIEKHRDQVVTQLTDPKLPNNVRAKYEWVARYHNYVLREFAKSFTPRDMARLDYDTLAEAEEAKSVLRFLIQNVPEGPEPKRLTHREPTSSAPGR